MIVADDHEEVLGGVAHLFVHAHDFDVREPLTIRAYFILAFYDENAPLPQNSERLNPTVPIQI
jgi:hypothetical protein